jgi:hypothetical protein
MMVFKGCISCSCSENLQTKNGIIICNSCLGMNSKSMVQFEKKRTKLFPEINQIIYGKLFLGNYDAAKSIDMLEKFKITHILICGKYMEKHFENDLDYLQLDLEDIIEENIERFFEITFDFIQAGERVFVHCNAGISRSPSIVIAYLMRRNKISFKEAFQKVKSCRENIFPNESFVDQLKAYEVKILKK